MTPADIPDGLRLCRASNWNQLDADWKFFLDHGGASVAVQNGTIVGSVAWLPFAADFAWLSMMLVDPAARGSGIGPRLMETAVEALSSAQIRLDATPAGEPMYRRFGFVNEFAIARTTASGGSVSVRARPIGEADLPGIFERDRVVFGADRSALLSDLYRRAPEFAWIGRGGSYCFGRPGHLYPQIGPVVGRDAAAARELIEHCMAMHAGTTFVLDVPQRSDGLDFSVERPFLRMRRGPAEDFGAPEQIFAITGPEFG
jgi:GNAT superfamily N-acetyltransferase